MAALEQHPKIMIEVTLRLSEVEARALNELASYNAEDVIKSVAEFSLGRHKDGFKSLFESVRKVLPPILRRTDAARKVFNEEQK